MPLPMLATVLGKAFTRRILRIHAYFQYVAVGLGIRDAAWQGLRQRDSTSQVQVSFTTAASVLFA